jgi:Asp-tRNA(Asn)/Glu-tRNA(Gln) amidotransferase A subunit family amidase
MMIESISRGIDNEWVASLSAAEAAAHIRRGDFTAEAYAAGQPGLVLPVGLSRTGLPVRLEFDGPIGSDQNLLSLGLAVQTVLKPVAPPPKPQGR